MKFQLNYIQCKTFFFHSYINPTTNNIKKKNILKKPVIVRVDKESNHGMISTSSTSKTRYNKPIKKYCKSKIEVEPKGSKPHSYCDAFSNKITL